MSDASQLAPRLFITGSGAGGSEESPTPDPLIGQLLDGRYRVIERLAEGGMGTVYRAEHVALQKEVAIKLVQDAGNSDHALRFLREALLTSRIDHPNVISAIDYGTFEHGAAYLVMSLVEGPTLAQVMRSESPLSWARAGEIGAQIADAVAAAQAQGIVHRDLKPENVLLQPMANGTEVVKVLDFGIAKYARDSLVPPHVRGAQHVTQMGVVVGTPGYMAPEQAVGMRADHRADLYSIGVMLWECVAGRRLWDCDDVQQLLTAQLSSRPARLRVESGDPSIPEEFETLVAALLATRPENRPQTAIETRDRLRALVDAERRESQPRVELPPIAAPGPIVSTPPPNTDTVFIDAAVAGWRARSAGDAARDASPSSDVTDDLPTTRVLSPVAVHEAVLQPTTQAGFRGGSRISLEDAVLGASENVQPHTQPAHDAASVSAVESASEQVDAVGVKSRALRLYVTVPLTLAVVSGMVWAALALDSSRARSSATLRAREISTTARGAASHSGATQASPAQAEVASGTASDTHGTSRAPASQPAPARTVSQSASGARVFVGAKQNVMSIVARANSERELGDALRAKARTNFRHAEFELAAQTYRLAIKVSPGYAGSYAGLGASQLALGDARGAISSYKEAIRRAPGSSGFHAALGRAYLMTRDQARAVAEYRKAVALNPANDVAAKALARLTL